MIAGIVKEAIISGVHILLVFLVFLFVYFAWKLVILFGDWLIWKHASAQTKVKALVKSLFNFILFFIVALSVLVFTIGWVNTNTNKTHLVQNNDYLMSVDKTIFDVYAPFWMQSLNNPLKPVFDFLSPWLVGTYSGLGVVLGIVFIIVLISNQKKFYQMFLALVLCGLFSLPFWYYFPALTPKEAYWANNSLLTQAPSDIKNVLTEYKPNDNLLDFLGQTNNDNKPVDLNSYIITTIPSMHVAWATLAVYFGIEVSRWLLLILGPYFILNFLATIFTLQHYAVDSFTGVLVAIVAILVAKLVIKSKKQSELNISAFIKDDINIFVKIIINLFK
jgi:hypothetical protein